MRIRIDISQRFPVAVAGILAVLALLLTLMSVFGRLSQYLVGEYLPGSVLENLVELFDAAFYLNNERSFPTLYTAMMLLLCSVLLAGITLSRRAVGARYVRHWGFLAVIFLYLFADELLQLHEEIIEPLRNVLGTGGFLYYAWIIPASILLLILGGLYANFIIDLPARIRLLFITAGVLYVSGAIGLEMVGGYYASSYGEESLGFVVEATAEEFLEMLGITVFIYALLEYMRLHVKEIVISPVSQER